MSAHAGRPWKAQARRGEAAPLSWGEEEVECGEVGRVGGEWRRGVRAGRGEEPQLSGDEAEKGVERGSAPHHARASSSSESAARCVGAWGGRGDVARQRD
jgi:hypothetical protein